MSLDFSDRPIHYPSNPEKFEFDDEVSLIFDNMAKRSIPLYDEVHKIHARMVVEEFKYNDARRGLYGRFNLLDIGSSTGRLFKELYSFAEKDSNFRIHEIQSYAIDPSPGMLSQVRDRYPAVRALQMECSEIGRLPHQFDVVALHYVLQFIPSEQQEDCLRIIRAKMKPGGLLLFAQKEEIECPSYSSVLTKHYNDFRLNMGYTQKEIDSKTAALKNSMWVSTQDETKKLFAKCGFSHTQETMRWGNFSAWVSRVYG